MKFQDLRTEVLSLRDRVAELRRKSEINVLDERWHSLQGAHRRKYVINSSRNEEGKLREMLAIVSVSIWSTSDNVALSFGTRLDGEERHHDGEHCAIYAMYFATPQDFERLAEVRRVCDRWAAGELDDLPQRMPWEVA